jgi:hypothetical protein
LTEQLALIPAPFGSSDVKLMLPVGTLGTWAVSVTVATQFVEFATRTVEGVQTTVVLVGSAAVTVSVWVPLLGVSCGSAPG